MEFGINTFPEQQIPNRSKTARWAKKHLDWATNSNSSVIEAVRKSYRHKKINEDLCLGKLDMSDLQLILNPDQIEAGYIPEKIQHYPIMNAKLQVLMGEESRRPFNYRVVVTNPTSISDIEEQKKQAIFNDLQQWVMNQSQSEEEAQEQLQKINKYYKYEYQDIREKRANELLKHYSSEQDFKLQFHYGFWDGLVLGEEIYQCFINNGEPYLEKINPFEIDTYMSGYSNKIEDADVIVITQYWSPGKIFDTFFSDKDFAKVSKAFMKQYKDFTHDGVGESDEYDDTAAYIRTDEEGHFIFDPFNAYGEHMADAMPYDPFGNIRVVRMYWKSRRKCKIVKKYDVETGESYTEFYTDEYITDFDAGEEEQIVWINEAWHGVKIGKDVYVDMGPMEIQYNRINNPSLCHFGIIGSIYSYNGRKPFSMVDMMKPYNYLYDVVKDRLNKALASDWGTMLDMDLALVPKGWDVDKWLYYAKVNHIRVRDSAKEGSGFLQGKAVGSLNNASQAVFSTNIGNLIQQYINLLEFIKAEMSEVVGISKQREGQVSNRETVGGVERATLQSSHITEWVFITHENLKKRVLECFLETAKTAMRGNNMKFSYITSDISQRVMSIDGNEFAENDYGLIVDNSQGVEEQTQKLDMLVQAGLQNQMINFSTAMKIFQTCSIAEKVRMIEQSEDEMLQREQQMQQQQQQMQQQEIEAKAQMQDREFQFKDQINQRDNETKILVASMNQQQDIDNDGIADNQERETLLEKMREFDANMKLENDKFLHQKELDKQRLEFDKQKNESDNQIRREQIRKQNNNKTQK